MQPKKEKVRIFALARELDMESKDLLTLCQQHGIDAKNQLSTIEPEVRDQIVQLVKKGPSTQPQASAPSPAAPAALPQAARPIRDLNTRGRSQPARAEASGAPSQPSTAATTPTPAEPEAPPPAEAAPAEPAPQTATPPPARPVRPTPAPVPPTPTPPVSAPPAPTASQEKLPIPADEKTPPASPSPAATKQPEPAPVTKAPAEPPARSPAPPAPPPEAPRTPLSHGPKPMRQLNTPRPSGQGAPAGQGGQPRPGPRPTLRPTPNIRIAPPSQQTGRPAQQAPGSARPGEKPAQQPPAGGARKLGTLTPEMIQAFQGRDTPPSLREIEAFRQAQQAPRAAAPGAPGVAPAVDEAEEEDRKGDKAKRPGGTGVAGRADRHKERSERQAKRKGIGEEPKSGRVTTASLLEGPVDRYRKSRHQKGLKSKQKPTELRKGKIPVSLPITVRSLSEAIGRKANDVLLKLIGHGAPMGSTSINSVIDPEMAELVALDFGAELDIKREADVEQQLIDKSKEVDAPEDLQPRAPVVVIMGHVDHGKTSLLDRIRTSNVVDTEAGGITQVIRAWRVVHNGHPITFLDTPGHEAFTKMRARGANVTDIAVIVVAANDGVMPQTEEAISHAKAAGVRIVVAINKVDLPDSNLRKTEQQLYGLGLIPDTMGGEVPFVQTSAKTGKGIDELLETLATAAEFAELKANPNKPATGTCLEAHLSEREGVQTTILVQDGTLRTGDVVLCGPAYGTVRRMYNDQGRSIDEAGPSVPVRIIGLDVVPNADDPFYVVPDLSTARKIADDRKQRMQEKSLITRGPLKLEDLKAAKIAELKVVLKAEARGSIEAIRNELEKLQHDEVRVRVLHHAIGGINVSDVQLALTSPEDTLILGFNVVPDNEAKALAEERGIQIRQYEIIYKLADDIRSALEGKLKPREEVVQLGRAVVRNTFKISRVGTIAGCFVTQGTIERSAKVRVIRAGVVVYPPPEKSVGLDSLKRFKDDAKEVREGFECGMKITGYDDIKVDDVIECYRIEQVQRSLS